MKELVITKENAVALKKGACIAVNGVKIAVSSMDGKAHECTTDFKPYPAVYPSMLRPSNCLNLTDSETEQAMISAWNEKDKYTIVYRSSGIKDGTGKPLTREEQIKNGTARKIMVIATPKEGTTLYSKDPNAYEWSCKEEMKLGDIVKLHVIVETEDF